MKNCHTRNLSLDIFRILCCFGVLSYHVMGNVRSSTVGAVIYYGSSYCIPGFFMLGGFLIGNKAFVTLEYAEMKVANLLMKFLGWCAFFSCALFFLRGKIINPFHEFLAAMQSGGISPVGWFLFTYCLCILFSPLLKTVLEKFTRLFFCCVAVLLLLLASGKFDFITARATQARWLHLYLTYFMLGMMLNKMLAYDFPSKHRPAIVLLSFLFFTGATIYFANTVIRDGASKLPHRYYGTWYHTIWVVCLFMLVYTVMIRLGSIFEKSIRMLARDTFAIYMIHLQILWFLTKIKPIGSASSAIFEWGGVFMVSVMLAELFRHLPVLRKIV